MKERFSEEIINWYLENKRDLPWRDIRDPYRIWVSEVILQQTRVVQGYDYYLRFIELFPTVEDLAKATEDEVLKCWQGLGYYSRARNMHAAAKSMNGVFPATYEEVLALKGVGEYTAAAICSFAYKMPYPAIDGNVYRVLSRCFGIEEPIDTAIGKRFFKNLSEELIDKQRPDLYNQGMMEFGALHCTPKSPDCLLCPFSSHCVALSEGTINLLPVKKTKVKVTSRYFNYFYVEVGENNILLNKRAQNDIWKNLYEFPLIEITEKKSLEQIMQEDLFLNWFYGIDEMEIKPVQEEVKHVLSHQIIHANFYKVRIPYKKELLDSFIEIKKSDLDKYPVSRLIHESIIKYFE
ncbi:MAG: A/G-specific adenine glycosylase [Bacteroidales bacterium]|nr:A/G-specific adenine glycosylase [Bacteroidales bacterium]